MHSAARIQRHVLIKLGRKFAALRDEAGVVAGDSVPLSAIVASMGHGAPGGAAEGGDAESTRALFGKVVDSTAADPLVSEDSFKSIFLAVLDGTTGGCDV